MLKKFTLFTICGLALLVFTTNAIAQTVRLGLITPLTGTLAFGGNEAKNGLALAIEAKKTLFGKEIELVVADAPDSTAAVSEMERLISREKLPVIFSGYGSSLEDAWQRVGEQHKVLTLGTVNWSDKLTEKGLEYYYRYAPPSSWLSLSMVEALTEITPEYLGKELKDLKIVVVNSDLTGYVTSPAIAEMEKRGFDLTHETYPSDLKDFTSLILKIRRMNPDVLILCQYTSDGMGFRRQMVAMDYEAPITMGLGLIYDQPEFATLGEVAADGALATSFTNPNMNTDVAPGLKEFRDLYTKRFGHSPLTHALQAYTAGLVYLEAIEKAGSLDVDKIRAEIENIDIEAGKTPSYWGAKFDKKTGQNMRAGKPFVIAQWKKGEYTVVWPKEFATDDLELPLKPFSKR